MMPAPRSTGGTDAQWVRVEGGPLRGHEILHDEGAAWQRAMIDGTYDSYMYTAMEPYSRLAGTTVWDIGAHFGYHTLALAAMVGSAGRVVAFEPNRSNLARLRMNLGRNRSLAARVDVMDIALSDRDGSARFLFSSIIRDGTSSGSHLENAMAPSPPEEYAAFKRATVRTATADRIWREGQAGTPAVIKIDVEGAESMVLEGARGLLSTAKPLLLVEVHNIMQMFHVQKLLYETGYAAELLGPEHASRSRCFIVAKGGQPI